LEDTEPRIDNITIIPDPRHFLKVGTVFYK